MPPIMIMGMRPHDVYHRVPPIFARFVGADHGIVVAAPYIIYTAIRTQPGRPGATGISGHSMWQTMRLSGKPCSVAARQLLEKPSIRS